MKGTYLSIGMSLLLFALVAGASHAQAPEGKPAIDPKADTVLRQMSDFLKKTPSTVVRLADTIDDVQPDGRKLQFAHIRELTVVRPDKLKIETTGDVTNRIVWLDGKTLTVLDKDKNVYAQLPDPGTIDQAVDMLQEKYNMSLPASDLLAGDPYQNLTEGCDSIEYVGLGYVGEEKCHHLAFSRENIDYQLWVGMGDKPAPRKIVITYKHRRGEPQYTLQVIKKEDASKIQDNAFKCEIPKGAEKIDFQPVSKRQ